MAALTLELTSRSGIVAPAGTGLISADYSSQEAMIAAYLSKDPTMMGVFQNPPTLTRLVNGAEESYENYRADMHTLTATACFPSLFEGRPDWEWVSIARKTLFDGKKSVRDICKTINYGILYMATAKTLADRSHVKMAVAEGWLKGHAQVYPQYHEWCREQADLATARGWSRTEFMDRIRMVNEDNAKAEGSSPGRSGVNMQVQGFAADVGKLALMYIYDALKGTGAKLCQFVHDEILVVAPGQAILDKERIKVKRGITHLSYKPDAELRYYAELVQSLMIKAESEAFRGELEGRADYKVAPYWNH